MDLEEIKKSKEVMLLEKEVPFIVDHANKLEVRSETEVKMASEFLVKVKVQSKNVEAERKKIVDPINKFKEGWQIYFRGFSVKLDDAEIIVKGKVALYFQKKEREQAEEQKKREERAMIAEEKRKKEIREQAERAREKGNELKAEFREEAAEKYFEPVPVVEKVKTNIKVESGSVYTSADIDFKITILKDAVEYLIKNGYDLSQFLTPKMKAFKSLIKQKRSQIPGIKWTEIKTISAKPA